MKIIAESVPIDDKDNPHAICLYDHSTVKAAALIGAVIEVNIGNTGRWEPADEFVVKWIDQYKRIPFRALIPE